MNTIDKETGEVLNVISFIPKHKDKLFVKIYPCMSEQVIHDLKSNGLHGAICVLFYLIDRMMESPIDMAAKIPACHKDVAKAINLSSITVSRHMSKLIKLSYIIQEDPRQQIYTVNPEMMFRGTLAKITKDIK